MKKLFPIAVRARAGSWNLLQTDESVADRMHSGVDCAGFTLMELLVVIAVILLITLIAIPNFSGMKIQANETSAIESLRSVYQAEVSYAAKYPTLGFACSLHTLGGGKTGQGTEQQARLLEQKLADGTKSGYRFSVTGCLQTVYKDALKNGTFSPYTSYEVVAVPVTLGKTGHRGFCVDQAGDIKADPTGGTNCSVSVQ
jgi:type IV pilus assembly protein PilA